MVVKQRLQQNSPSTITRSRDVMQLLREPIEALGLSPYVLNKIKMSNQNIKFIGDLVISARGKLTGARFSENIISQVQMKLAEKGLSLNMDLSNPGMGG